jgi:hypothetical protein
MLMNGFNFLGQKHDSYSVVITTVNLSPICFFQTNNKLITTTEEKKTRLGKKLELFCVFLPRGYNQESVQATGDDVGVPSCTVSDDRISVFIYLQLTSLHSRVGRLQEWTYRLWCGQSFRPLSDAPTVASYTYMSGWTSKGEEVIGYIIRGSTSHKESQRIRTKSRVSGLLQ